MLARVAKDLKLATADRRLHSNMGGPAVLGEVILHSDEIYIQVHATGVLVRTCNGRRDYTGDVNHMWPHASLADTHAFALKVRGLIVAKIAARNFVN